VREEITKENVERCKIKPYGVAERMKPWFEKEGEGMRRICGRISRSSKGKKYMRSSYQLPELLYRKENDQGSLQPAGLFLEENSNAPEPAFINRSSKH